MRLWNHEIDLADLQRVLLYHKAGQEIKDEDFVFIQEHYIFEHKL